MKREREKWSAKDVVYFPSYFQNFSELFGLQWCLKYSLSH